MRIILSLAAALISTASQAQYYKYSDILIKDRSSQNMYISGVADALARSGPINICLGLTLKMQAGQLTTNVLNFAASRPALHSGSMADVVAQYLKEACATAQ